MLRQNNRNYEILFVFSCLSTFLIWFILLCHNPVGIQLNVFFRQLKESFADFFFVNCYIAERDPYFNLMNGPEHKNYLPLAYVLLYPFTVFHSYKDTTFLECFSSRLGMISAIFFEFFQSLVLLHSLFCLAKRLKVKTGIVFSLFVSGIFLFAFERGNLIIFTVALVNYYLSFYDSEDKKMQYFAVVAITVAAVLKIYPVLFGILYIKKKQYKNIIIAFILGVILTILPFCFFKRGIQNIPKMVSNILLFSQIYGHKIQFDSFGFYSSILLIFRHLKFSNHSIEYILFIYKIFIISLSIISLFLVFLSKKQFNVICLIIMIIIFLPNISWWYCGLYLFPGVLFFLSSTQERSSLYNVMILFCLILILTPIQFGFTTSSRFINMNHFLGSLTCFILWIFIITDELLVLFKQKKSIIIR